MRPTKFDSHDSHAYLGILSWKSGRLILAYGVLMASVTLVGFWWSYQGSAEKLDEARAVAFCILTLTQIFYSMACRDFDRIMPRLGVFSNPFIGSSHDRFACCSACCDCMPLVSLHSRIACDALVGLAIHPVSQLDSSDTGRVAKDAQR